FSGLVLTAHMLQHMMLMMMAPPLLLLGAPLVPLVRGLPIFAAREFAGPFLNWRVANRVGSFLTHPIVALLMMGVTMFAWHTPRLYELALASSSWHEFEHACFFLTSLIFWWPVIQPWPSRAQWPRWAIIPYLLIGDVQNTILSATLIFADRVLYPSYATTPRLFGFSAQQDQAAAGAIMWVLGGMAFIIPAVVIAIQCLQRRRDQAETAFARPRESSSLETILSAANPFALAHRYARRRWSSRTVEAVSFLVLFAVCGLYLAHLASASSDDDDHTLRLHQQSGPFIVAVFAAPGDLASGPGTFSVLVQDSNTREVLRDAIVDLSAQRAGDGQRSASVRASADGSENKLLQSAEVDFPADGDWTVAVAVQRGPQSARVSVPLHVAKSEAGIAWPWAYLVLLAFSLVLLSAYLWRHRNARTVPVEQPVSTL
ncbi:MAG: cytochrome c oxidase assembly protein, partial [Candidatus Korobacteraceae bacterium]